MTSIAAFPASAKAIVAAHTVDLYISLNDVVHMAINKLLMEDEELYFYLRATDNDDAITGSLYLDRAHVARRVMAYAIDKEVVALKHIREHAMVRHVNVVIRRERRNKAKAQAATE